MRFLQFCRAWAVTRKNFQDASAVHKNENKN